jgi:hypothetical protein
MNSHRHELPYDADHRHSRIDHHRPIYESKTLRRPGSPHSKK